MNVIKVSATDSTNLHLKRMLQESILEDYTVIVAETQQQGRGQGGSQWTTESGKNLTFSVLKHFKNFHVKDKFLISMAVSLAIYKALRAIQIPDLSIKWPNDILSGTRKLCGILIENTLKGSQLKLSIIGIGININQKAFDSLPNATSLTLISGKTYDLETLLMDILLELKRQLALLEEHSVTALEKEYQQLLFKKGELAVYNINGRQVEGIIRGVTKEGRLLLELGTQGVVSYGLKEIGYCL
ncbi:MAG: biotin--[acetyl-CoA-carboxylase] ligase [Eudoraea sp.]|nr:biotin--[acetyl-CoA-carboxylase] ligase [Eudoraea sp.]